VTPTMAMPTMTMITMMMTTMVMTAVITVIIIDIILIITATAAAYQRELFVGELESRKLNFSVGKIGCHVLIPFLFV
jgi:hypothetical protein